MTWCACLMISLIMSAWAFTCTLFYSGISTETNPGWGRPQKFTTFSLKWLWPFRLINYFPAHQHFRPNTVYKKSSLIKAWACWIFLTFAEIIESHPKFLSILRILTVLLFAISIKTYQKYIFQRQPSNFWCSEFHLAIMILRGLALSLSTCWACCHR